MNDVLITQKAVVRTPIYSIELYKKIISGSISIDEILEDSYFLIALYIASPDLYSQVEEYRKGRLSSDKIEKFRKSLLKYVFRASTRSTPFGMFSGVGVCNIKKGETALQLHPKEKNYFHVRLDMDLVGRITLLLENDKVLQKYLKYTLNNTIYEFGEEYRYLQSSAKGGIKSFSLSKVDRIREIEDIQLRLKTSNYLSKDDLAQVLVRGDIGFDDALDFVDQMIEEQFLVSELQMSTIGIEAGQYLAHKIKIIFEREIALEDREYVETLLRPIESLQSKVAQYSFTESNTIENLKADFQSLKCWLPEINEKFIFQVDTISSPEITSHLSESLIEQIQEVTSILSSFKNTTKSNDRLTTFIKRYNDRYDGESKRLVDVIDVETGIGYGIDYDLPKSIDEILDGIPFNSKKELNHSIKIEDTPLTTAILNALKSNTKVLYLDSIPGMKNGSSIQETYSTYSSIFSLFDSGDKTNPIIYLNGTGGHSGAMLMTRFSHASQDINTIVGEITNYEDTLNPDAIIAEVNHLPQDRLGNVLQRPSIRTHEIAYLASSSLDHSSTIDISDIWISIVNGKVKLWSKKLGKEILPYITSALLHDKNTLPTFHFLGDIQKSNNQFSSNIEFFSLLKMTGYIPRICYKNIIIKLATWHLNNETIDKILSLKTREGIQYDEVRSIIKKLGIPDSFIISEFDNDMPISLNHDESLGIFLDLLSKKEFVIIQEFLASEYEPLVKDAAGHALCNEFIVPFGRKQNGENTEDKYNIKNRNEVRRSFLPFNEWVYFKIYTGPDIADSIVQELNDIGWDLQKKNAIEKWFFIRYSDPEHHLRVRFKIVPNMGNEVIATLNSIFSKYYSQGKIWKVSIDTYQRELERYGFSQIDYVEDIFHADSIFASQICNVFQNEYRLISAISSIKNYFEVFSIGESDILLMLEDAKQSFDLEFNSDKNVWKYLNKYYSAHKKSLFELLDNKYENDSSSALINQILSKRTEMLKTSILLIKQSPEYDKTQLFSLIHMSINRLFKSRQRIYEYVAYYFLKTYYTSKHFEKVHKS